MSAVRARAAAAQSPARAFLRDNGLTIALSTLFVLAIVAMGWTGWKAHDSVLVEHGVKPIGLAGYLRSGAWASAVFENWESEFLQMADKRLAHRCGASEKGYGILPSAYSTIIEEGDTVAAVA